MDDIQRVQQKIDKERRILEALQQMLTLNEGNRDTSRTISENIRSSQQAIEYLQAELSHLISGRDDPTPSLPARGLSPRIGIGGVSIPLRLDSTRPLSAGIPIRANSSRPRAGSSPSRSDGRSTPTRGIRGWFGSSLTSQDEDAGAKRLLSDIGLPEPRFPARGATPVPASNHFQYLRTEIPLSSEKIAYKARSVQQKVTVEVRFREGAEKLLGALLRQQQLGGNSSPTSTSDEDLSTRLGEIRKKLSDSNAKTAALTSSVQRWKGMGGADAMRESAENEIPKSPVGGHLSCAVLAVLGLPNRKQGSDLYAVVRVDQQECGRTRPERLGVWKDEVLETNVERALEVEVSIMEQTYANVHYSGQQAPTVQGIVWFHISDLVAELSLRGAGKNGMLVWLELEPSGQVLLKLNFAAYAQRAKGAVSPLLGMVNRRAPIKKVYVKRGHKFVPKLSSTSIKCATCGDFFYTGYVCEECRYACHKDCADKIIAKCISSTDEEAGMVIKHRIPHRFNGFFNPPLAHNYCSHCGLGMSAGKSNNMKCGECGIVCHEDCSLLVPSTCGIPRDDIVRAMQLVDQIHRERVAKKRAEEARAAREEEQKRLREYEQEREEELRKAKKAAEEAEARLLAEVEARRKAEVEQIRLEEQIKLAESSKQQEVQQLQETLEQIKQKRSKTEEEQEEAQRLLEEAKQKEEDEKNRLAALIDLQKRLAEEAKLKALDRQARAAAIAASLNAGYSPNVPPQVSSPVAAEPSHSENVVESKPTQLPTVNFPPQSPPSAAPSSPPAPAISVPVRKSSAMAKLIISAEDFNFLKVLGRGAYGKVMMAEEKATGQIYAVKVLKKAGCLQPEDFEALQTEKNLFLLANRDRYPFLVSLHSCFQTQNHIWFVQEFLSGGDLMWHVQHSPNGRFDEARAKFYAAQILLALHFFHQNNVIYRDLKLENILVSAEGNLKLADYGICKEDCGPDDDTTTMCGTPEYMAPEICQAQPYNKSADWWSYGVLLYQMMTGRSPFHGSNDDEIFAAVVNDPLSFPMDVPLSRMAMGLIRRLLEKDPVRRLGSGPADGYIVMKHPWFADVDFEKVAQLEVEPPFIPEVTSVKDASNFDSSFTSERAVLTPTSSPISAQEQDLFRGFSYVSDWVLEKRREGLGMNASSGVPPSTIPQ
ncbi:hypothetical protein M427DRAFT_119397 [Gonapodya prolifera JEL478]|uniref:protein kinase C n=1 Tax=Gonapodya prolifera (strain JEL478) TaxID=1344416 RepID=A0A139AWK8_GONPJ|nr:hypothetical protein M427DRAFT_119397 [Gonapodya prolifera JEL478]|eukprot:KXS20855.1 hypothetical protein M427DRAFT_119397 [Gonapodya prolifera JEL478]